MDLKTYLSLRSRSKDTTSESIGTNGKNGKTGLMKRLLITKLTKDDQLPVLFLPARWWPDTLPEFESGGYWPRPHTRVRCRQCKCIIVENPSFRSSKFHGCEKQLRQRQKTGRHSSHQCRSTICRETGRSARR